MRHIERNWSLTLVDGNQRQEWWEKKQAYPGGISNDSNTTCYHSKKELNKKKINNSVLLSQPDQIRGASYFALAGNPTRVADRVSTLIKSWDSLVLERHPTRSQPALIYRGLKMLPGLISMAHVHAHGRAPVWTAGGDSHCGGGASWDIKLQCDQGYPSSFENLLLHGIGRYFGKMALEADDLWRPSEDYNNGLWKMEHWWFSLQMNWS